MTNFDEYYRERQYSDDDIGSAIPENSTEDDEDEDDTGLDDVRKELDFSDNFPWKYIGEHDYEE